MHNRLQVLFLTAYAKQVFSYITKWETDAQIQHTSDCDFVEPLAPYYRLYINFVPDQTLGRYETPAFSFVFWEKGEEEILVLPVKYGMVLMS